MKILIVINELNIRGGTHKQTLRLCQYLSKYNEVKIYTRIYDKDKTYPEFADFDIITPNFKKRKSDKFINKIVTKIYNHKVEKKIIKNLLADSDIVNIHDCCSFAILNIIKHANKKVVLQINDMPQYFLVGNANGKNDTIKNKLYRKLYKFFTKNVDEITVNVTKNKEVVKKCLNRDAHVLYCGVDVNKSLEKHIEMHDNKKINLFSSGVFFPYRNYETLVKVVEKLVKNNIDVHLDIMGSTDMDKEYANFIKNMIDDLNLNEYIKVWGQVDEEKYVELHNNADIFLFININQSWGLAVFEAMSCGLPVIVSNSVGAIELLDNDENSIIVDPENVDEVYDKIMKLKNDATYYEKISDNAYNIVKEFSWDNLYSSKMLEIFENIIKEK